MYAGHSSTYEFSAHTAPSQKLSAPEESELISRLLADDPQAWRQFRSQYSRIIFYSINKVTRRFGGLVHTDDVEDIFATFCLELLAHDKRKLRTFDPNRGHKFATWLGLLATHTAYDFLRGLRKNPRTDLASETETLASEADSPAELVSQREQAQLVHGLLGHLTTKEREFITLYYSEDMEPDEVANRMGIHVKTVYSKKHKIQNRLATLAKNSKIAA